MPYVMYCLSLHNKITGCSKGSKNLFKHRRVEWRPWREEIIFGAVGKGKELPGTSVQEQFLTECDTFIWKRISHNYMTKSRFLHFPLKMTLDMTICNRRTKVLVKQQSQSDG